MTLIRRPPNPASVAKMTKGDAAYQNPATRSIIQ